MSYTLIYTTTRFAVPPAGFDSDYRYLRRAATGTIAVSAGRTWRLGSTAQTNGGQPWVAYKFDCGVSGSAVNMTSTVVAGTQQTWTVADVNPTAAMCAIR